MAQASASVSVDPLHRVAQLDEAGPGKGLGAGLEPPLALEEHHVIPMDIHSSITVELGLELGEGEGLALDPAGHGEAEPLDPGVDAVLGGEARLDHVELELADHAEDGLALPALGG